jgi:hypothetical protein
MYRAPKVDYLNLYDGYFQRVHNSDTLYPSPGYLFTSGGYTASEEHLVDVADSRNRTMNPCQHYRRKVTRNSGYTGGLDLYYALNLDPSQGYWVQTQECTPQWVWQTWSDWLVGSTSPDNCRVRFGNFWSPDNGLPILCVVGSNSIRIIEPSSIPSLLNRAITAMLPGIKAADNVSLLNSIYELKDVKSLPHTLQLIRDTFVSNKRVLSAIALMRSNPGASLRRLLRAGGDSYLQTQFNILPMLSDIVAVRRAIADTRNQLRQLVSRAGKPQKRHYKVILSDDYVDKLEKTNGAIPDGYVRKRMLAQRAVSYVTREFNATMEYSYSLPSWTNEDSLMEALLDRMGVNLNPRIIWNAIPWSFVVDWVIGVGRWLDQFKERNIEPTLYIRGACYSVKVVRFITTAVGFDSTDPCATIEESAYKRELIPSLYNSLLASGLNAKEFSLAAALAVTR